VERRGMRLEATVRKKVSTRVRILAACGVLLGVATLALLLFGKDAELRVGVLIVGTGAMVVGLINLLLLRHGR